MPGSLGKKEERAHVELPERRHHQTQLNQTSRLCRMCPDKQRQFSSTHAYCGAMCPGMIATQQELFDARVPLHWRDYCAHLLIPLNDCRRETYYLPWRCKHERHVYENCQFKDWLWRQEKFRQNAAAANKEEKLAEAARRKAHGEADED